MDKEVHIIWGNSYFSESRINTLQSRGTKKIFVLDDKKNPIVKERKDVVYFSEEIAPFLWLDEPEKVHHLLLTVPKGKYKKK